MTRDINRISNLDFLHELSNGNAVFINEMIAVFLLEMPEVLEVFEKSIKEHDYEIIKQTSHNLKSTIHFVGLNLIIEKEVFEMERISESKTGIEEIKILFTKVKEKCEKAVEELYDHNKNI